MQFVSVFGQCFRIRTLPKTVTAFLPFCQVILLFVIVCLLVCTYVCMHLCLFVCLCTTKALVGFFAVHKRLPTSATLLDMMFKKTNGNIMHCKEENIDSKLTITETKTNSIIYKGRGKKKL